MTKLYLYCVFIFRTHEFPANGSIVFDNGLMHKLFHNLMQLNSVYFLGVVFELNV